MSVISVIVCFLAALIIKSLLGIDLFPALVVQLAIYNSPEGTILFSSFSGFVQDALFYPGFLNFLSYTVVGGLAVYLKRFFAFEEDALAMTLTLIAAPLSVIVVAIGMRIFQGVMYPSLIFSLIKVTFANGLLVLAINYFLGNRGR
ncbi:MAG TPA: hypothetical protein VMD02_00795 [Candidatus Omnitrophota bacterium]|nr:hypothetical protein [Candidatus Omnitrophota bacterium]